MSMIYFRKELPQNRIRDKKGRQIPFEILNDSIGVAVFDLDDGAEFEYVEALREFAEKRTGGVSELTEQQFLDLKKNSSLNQRSKPQKQSAVKVLRPVSPYRPPQNAGAAAEGDTEGGVSKKENPQPFTPSKENKESQTAKKTSEPETTSSVETNDAPWNDAEEVPRTAKIEDHGNAADIPSTEAEAS